jgi:peptidoglycan/LPS O-acetylase OafA/YrhL
MVFTTHAGFFSLGWVGVQLFFVLSGLFITGILRRSREDISYWPPFYLRRATRILPPLVIAFLGAALLGSIPWKQVGFYEVFFLANVAETMFRGHTGTLGVLWSLAVEEQFYFLWPFAVRFLKRGHLITLLVVVLIAEPVIRGIATPMVSTFWPIFFLTPFQLDGLAGGSLLALLLEDEYAAALLKTWSSWLLVTSTSLFVVLSMVPSFHREANSILFNSIGYSLINLSSCGFVAYVFFFEEALPSRLLGSRLAGFLGSISYGLYLFHPMALNLVGRMGMTIHFYHNRILAPFTLLAVILFSWLSFRFYEQPITSWGRRRARTLQLMREDQLEVTT